MSLSIFKHTLDVLTSLFFNQRNIILETSNSETSLGNTFLLTKFLGINIISDTWAKDWDSQGRVYFL